MSDSTYNNNLRRWFHFICISTFGLVYGLSSFAWNAMLMPLCIAALILISFDLIRIHIPYLNYLIQETFTCLLRSHEFHSISGSSWFLLSAIICIIVFPKSIAALGFLYLAVGDPVASYTGIRWGKTKIGEKSWMGCFAFFMSCWAVGNLYLWAVTPFANFIYISGISAFISALTERNLKEMDDNLVIPIITCSVIFLLSLVIG